MTEQPPAAATPAVEPQGGIVPVAKPETKTLTQAELNTIIEDRLKRDREAREKELGMSTKEAKALIKARKDAEEAEKTALEKANEKAIAFEKALKARDLKDLKRSKVEGLIAEKKIKLPDGVSISDVLDTVTGEDEDGINTSLGRLPKFFPFNASMGSGSNPANGSPKDPTIDEKIAAAEKAGDWTLATSLKLQKQREMFKS